MKPAKHSGLNTFVASAALMLVIVGGAAKASDTAFVMSAVENQAAGDTILSGDYAKAVSSLRTGAYVNGDAFAKATNLCVSLTMEGQIDDAVAYCERALRHSRAQRRAIGYGPEAKRFHALALSNRGVLRGVSGDIDGAQRDFELAAKISSALDSPVLNLEHLETVKIRMTATN